MADSLGQAVLELRVDGRELFRGLDEAERRTGGLGPLFDGTSTSALKMVGTIAALTGAVALLGSAFRSAKSFISDSIEASNQQEEAIAGLNATLVSTGQFTEEYSAKLQGLASQIQETTKFGDEQVLGIERLLVAMGAAPDQIERLTRASLDLAVGLKGAAATEQDAASAAQLLGKAVAGEFGTLSRYGIIVDKNASDTEKLDQALKQIEERFGGQAAAAAETFGGQIQQVSNIFGDFMEVIGDAVKGSGVLTDALGYLKSELLDLVKYATQNREAFTALVNDGLRAAALGALDFAAVLLSVGDAVQTVGSKIGALAAISVGFFTRDTELMKAGWSGLVNEVETSSGRALAKLAEMRAKVEGFGATAQKEMPRAAEVTKSVGQAGEEAAEGVAKVGPAAEVSAGKTVAAFEQARGAISAFQRDVERGVAGAMDAADRSISNMMARFDAINEAAESLILFGGRGRSNMVNEVTGLGQSGAFGVASPIDARNQFQQILAAGDVGELRSFAEALRSMVAGFTRNVSKPGEVDLFTNPFNRYIELQQNGLRSLETEVTRALTSLERTQETGDDRRHHASIASLGRIEQGIVSLAGVLEENNTETRSLRQAIATGSIASSTASIIGAGVRLAGGQRWTSR